MSGLTRKAVIAGSGAAGLIVLAAAFLLIVTNQQPDWFQVPDPTNPAVMERAEAVEGGASHLISDVRPEDEPWRVRIRAEDANAWFAAGLPRWMANRGEQWPEHWTTPVLTFSENQLQIAFARMEDGGVGRVYGLSAELRITPDGDCLISDARVRIGRLMLPAAMAGDRLRTGLEALPLEPPEVDRLVRVIREGGVLAPRLSLALGDGRSVSLESLAIRDDEILLTCMTHRRERDLAEAAD